MSFQIAIPELKGFQVQLEGLSSSKQKQTLNNALKNASSEIMKITRKNVRSAGGGSGASAKAIKSVKIKSKGRRGFLGYRVASGKRSDIATKHPMGENAFSKRGYYPAHQELGFTHTSGKSIPAKNTMAKTFDTNYQKVLRTMATAMTNYLNKIK